MGTDYKSTLDSLRSSQTMWHTVADSIAVNQMYAVSLIRKFYDAWAAGQNPWDTLPQDNPNTLADEGVTPTEFTGMVDKFFDQFTLPPNAPPPPLTPEQLAELEGNINTIKAKLREFFAQKMTAENQANAVESEIKNVEALQKSDTSSE